MSTIIKRLKDKLGNFVLPITNTKAVYDDNGNRLDGTLKTINQSLNRISNADYVGEASIDQVITQWANKYAPSTGSKNLMGSIGSNDGTYHITAYVDANKNAMGFLARFTGENASFTCYGGISTVIGPFTSTSLISDSYDSSKTYSVGQYCIHNNTLWKSKVDNNAGNTPPNEIYWEATNVGKHLITTNGEGTYGYLGADDSFVPFKSSLGVAETLVNGSYYSSPSSYTLEKDYSCIIGIFAYNDGVTGCIYNDVTKSYPVANTRLSIGNNRNVTVYCFYDCKQGDVIKPQYSNTTGYWSLLAME